MGEFLEYYDSVKDHKRRLDEERRAALAVREKLNTIEISRKARALSEVVDPVLETAKAELKPRGIVLVNDPAQFDRQPSAELKRSFRLEREHDRNQRSSVYVFEVNDADMVMASQLEIFGVAQEKKYRCIGQINLKYVDRAFVKRAVLLSIDNLMRI